ncbi:MAG: GerMN domain-containing protein, partial [Patescibacteria group bacterium]
IFNASNFMTTRNTFLVLMGGVLILALGFVLGARLIGGEDNWICDGGKWVKHGNPSAPAPTEKCGNAQNDDRKTSGVFVGFVQDTDFDTLIVKVETGGQQLQFLLDETTKVFALNGRGIADLRGLVKGYKVSVAWEEKEVSPGEMVSKAKEVRIIEEIKPAQVKETRIDSPQPNEAMTSPYKVTGAMPGNWFFEATAAVKLLDANGKGLGFAHAQSKSNWMTNELVPFEATLKFDTPTTLTGTLILQADNPSGLPKNDKQERYIVHFLPTVKIFFNNDKFDPNLMDCSKVYPVNRSIKPTLEVARAALEALFKGLAVGERNLGYLTNLNSGVKIQTLKIENGVAKVDFSSELEKAVGGSCRTAAIRAQITETLKQFPTVREVIISINGRTEDILQP